MGFRGFARKMINRIANSGFILDKRKPLADGGYIEYRVLSGSKRYFVAKLLFGNGRPFRIRKDQPHQFSRIAQ